MKEPRTEDFDPKASGLKSPLVGMPTIQTREERQAAKQAHDLMTSTTHDPKTSRGVRVNGSSPHDPMTSTGERRTIKRASFEMYEDQVQALRRIMHQDQLNGVRNDTSKMVRQAVDEYLAKRGEGK